MHCPNGEYLTRLHPERLDVSDTYAVSGRCAYVWTHIIFFLIYPHALCPYLHCHPFDSQLAGNQQLSLTQQAQNPYSQPSKW